jgi:hypothetical protein
MNEVLISREQISARILVLRGRKLLLDRDVVALHGIETRTLNQAVKRKRDRFPDDFMFAHSRDEIVRLSHPVTSSPKLKFSRRVHAFRAALESNRARARKFSGLEERVEKQDAEVAAIIEAIRQSIAPPLKMRRENGFHLRKTSPRCGTRHR